VEDINANIEKLDTRGPVSKYNIPELGIRGRLVHVTIPDINILSFVRLVRVFCIMLFSSQFNWVQ
jgi:hypothetical protein